MFPMYCVMNDCTVYYYEPNEGVRIEDFEEKGSFHIYDFSEFLNRTPAMAIGLMKYAMEDPEIRDDPALFKLILRAWAKYVKDSSYLAELTEIHAHGGMPF